MKKIITGLTFTISMSTATLAMGENLYGIFMVVKGDIKVQNVKKETAPAKVGLKILSGEAVISGIDSRAKIVMADRNVINISPDSKLVIEKYQNDTKSGTKNVEMNLIQGKVRNNVEQTYDGEKSKFLVKTPTAVAGVRGTQFLTSFNPKTNVTNIVTLKGVVTLAPANVTAPTPDQVVLVKKGETTSVSDGKPPEQPKAVPKEELNKIDKESQASRKAEEPATEKVAGGQDAKNKKEDGDSGKKDVAAGEGPKSDAAKADPSKSPGDRAPASPGGPDAAPPLAGGGPQGPEGGGPKGPGGPPTFGGPGSMINTADLDTSIVREIKNPYAQPPMAPPPVFAPPPLANQPPPNPAIGDIIRRNLGKTTLTITPVKN